MKTAFELFFIFNILLCAQAHSKTCQEYESDMKTHCLVVGQGCSSISSCVTRRNRCIDDIPKNRENCLSLNRCMDAVGRNLAQGEKCEYYWNDLEAQTNREFCSVKRLWLSSQEGCPGKSGGILSNLTYGVAAEVDSQFNCKAVKNKYHVLRRHCIESINSFKNHCRDQVNLTSRHNPSRCEAYENFNSLAN